MRQYSALPNQPLQQDTTFHRPSQSLPPQVSPEDPALSVMTDFRQVTAFTIDPDVSVDTAARVMRRRNVHLLLVVDVENHVLGVITSKDLLGEKPLLLTSTRGISRAELRVRDIMTAADRIEVIAMEDVQRSCVGHVIATLKNNGRRHAAVVEVDADGRQTIRGLFAASQLARQLGEPVETTEVAHTFAEISAALKA